MICFRFCKMYDFVGYSKIFEIWKIENVGIEKRLFFGNSENFGKIGFLWFFRFLTFSVDSKTFEIKKLKLFLQFKKTLNYILKSLNLLNKIAFCIIFEWNRLL